MLEPLSHTTRAVRSGRPVPSVPMIGGWALADDVRHHWLRIRASPSPDRDAAQRDARLGDGAHAFPVAVRHSGAAAPRVSDRRPRLSNGDRVRRRTRARPSISKEDQARSNGRPAAGRVLAPDRRDLGGAICVECHWPRQDSSVARRVPAAFGTIVFVAVALRIGLPSLGGLCAEYTRMTLRLDRS